MSNFCFHAARTRERKQNNLRWDAPGGLAFPMPIEVEINGKSQRVEMRNGAATIDYDGKNTPVIDRQSLILKAMQ